MALDQNTIGFTSSTQVQDARAVVVLTVLQHPDPSRVGQTATLFSSTIGGVCALSRVEPDFGPWGGRASVPLASPLLSRKALWIKGTSDGDERLEVVIEPSESSARYLVDGEPLLAPLVLDGAALQRGVVIDLAHAVLLLLHEVPPLQPDELAASAQAEDLGLLGASAAMRQVRREIRRVADLDTCVLIRGESGSGKELVARALHQQSPRSAKPYVAVNMAAIPPSVAASMLFGHSRGAFTGASEASTGFFRQADRGTLFLDEIGDAPVELQPALLRAIREGEVQPVGEATVRKVNVRLISATDANLETLVDGGKFSMPLLRRIEGYTLAVPPLRARRDDIARLFFRFLLQELELIGEAAKLTEPAVGSKPWLPTGLLEALLTYSFPGNVAELRTLTQQLVISNRGQARFRLEPRLAERLGVFSRPELAARLGVTRPVTSSLPVPVAEGLSGGHSAASANESTGPEAGDSGGTVRRDTASLTDAEIAAALREHRFKVKAAAEALGVSRSWLNERIEDCQGVRKANSLNRDEIAAAGARCDWKIARMAEILEVSEHGLKLRMRALDVPVGH